MNTIEWSGTEKEVAQEAFNKAYEREIDALLRDVRERASSITRLEEMWQLHDFLSARRHEIDGKYDYRDPMLLFTFARLVKEGWLHLMELEGLAADKLTKISVLTRM